MIRRTTWILLGLFAVSLVVVFIWSQSQPSQSLDATPTVKDDFLFDTNGIPVVGFKISTSEEQNSQLKSLVFEKNDEEMWILVEPSGEQVDSMRIDSAVSAIESMRVLTKLESEIDKELIALAPPAYILEIELENGETQTVFIGNRTPTQDGYYAYEEGGPIIVVSEYSVVPVLEMLKNPPIISTQSPSPTP